MQSRTRHPTTPNQLMSPTRDVIAGVAGQEEGGAHHVGRNAQPACRQNSSRRTSSFRQAAICHLCVYSPFFSTETCDTGSCRPAPQQTCSAQRSTSRQGRAAAPPHPQECAPGCTRPAQARQAANGVAVERSQCSSVAASWPGDFGNWAAATKLKAGPPSLARPASCSGSRC